MVCALPVGPLRDVAVRGVSAERLESLHRQRSALAATPPDRLAPFLATPPERRREEFLTTLAKLMNDEALHPLLHGRGDVAPTAFVAAVDQLDYRLEAHCGDEAAASRVTRRWSAPGVERRELHGEGFAGALFTPPGAEGQGVLVVPAQPACARWSRWPRFSPPTAT